MVLTCEYFLLNKVRTTPKLEGSGSNSLFMAIHGSLTRVRMVDTGGQLCHQGAISFRKISVAWSFFCCTASNRLVYFSLSSLKRDRNELAIP